MGIITRYFNGWKNTDKIMKEAGVGSCEVDVSEMLDAVGYDAQTNRESAPEEVIRITWEEIDYRPYPGCEELDYELAVKAVEMARGEEK